MSVAWVAGRAVSIPEEELNEALRRALVVRAVGGNPQRELSVDEAAVTRLAEELDGATRRQQLRRGLEELRAVVVARPAAVAALEALVADEDRSWRCFAAGSLAAELA